MLKYFESKQVAWFFFRCVVLCCATLSQVDIDSKLKLEPILGKSRPGTAKL